MVDSSRALSKVHPEWLDALDFNAAISVLRKLEGSSDSFAPDFDSIFRVFQNRPLEIKVVIVGQDPYPTPGDATGIAFSVDRNHKLPKSLQNIFKELAADLGNPLRSNGDLSDWQNQGVFLINRILTVPIGKPLGHKDLGWEEFTETAIAHLGSLGAVGLLMGKSAEALASKFKDPIITAHPSPLSAHRGFFGAKPFSRINKLITQPIIWG